MSLNPSVLFIYFSPSMNYSQAIDYVIERGYSRINPLRNPDSYWNSECNAIIGIEARRPDLTGQQVIEPRQVTQKIMAQA